MLVFLGDLITFHIVQRLLAQAFQGGRARRAARRRRGSVDRDPFWKAQATRPSSCAIALLHHHWDTRDDDEVPASCPFRPLSASTLWLTRPLPAAQGFSKAGGRVELHAHALEARTGSDATRSLRWMNFGRLPPPPGPRSMARRCRALRPPAQLDDKKTSNCASS